MSDDAKLKLRSSLYEFLDKPNVIRDLGVERVDYMRQKASLPDVTNSWLTGANVYASSIDRHKLSPFTTFVKTCVLIFSIVIRQKPLSDNEGSNEPTHQDHICKLATEMWCVTFAAVHQREPSDEEYDRLSEAVRGILALIYPRGYGKPVVDQCLSYVLYSFMLTSTPNNKIPVKTRALKVLMRELLEEVFGDTKWRTALDDSTLLYDYVFYEHGVFVKNLPKNVNDKDLETTLLWGDLWGPILWTWIHLVAERTYTDEISSAKFIAFLMTFDVVLTCDVCEMHFNSSPLVAYGRRLVNDEQLTHVNLTAKDFAFILHANVNNTDKTTTHSTQKNILRSYEMWWTVV